MFFMWLLELFLNPIVCLDKGWFFSPISVCFIYGKYYKHMVDRLAKLGKSGIYIQI